MLRWHVVYGTGLDIDFAAVRDALGPALQGPLLFCDGLHDVFPLGSDVAGTLASRVKRSKLVCLLRLAPAVLMVCGHTQNRHE